MLGSTHKTFFGPQGGIILVKEDMDLAEQIDITLRPNPVLVDNYHHHRVAALAIALAELLAYGREYAKQVVKNAKTLAEGLDERSVPVVGSHLGFTSSHQVLLQTSSNKQGLRMRDQLEAADIIADAGVRLGSQEVTRRGMKNHEMREIAELISDILIEKEKPEKIKQSVHSMGHQFQDVHFCFDNP